MRRNAAALLMLALLVTAACGRSEEKQPAGGAPGSPAALPELRLGYFPNLTHAGALVGVARGIFAKHLEGKATLKTSTFNAGPSAVEALFSNAVDATYIGPNPAINAFQKSNGTAIRIIAGATSGGAALVVKPGITKPADLKGKKIASPQLGNTQDVALRAWLKKQDLSTNVQGGGDVSVVPQENAQTLETFRAGQIDGAWVPEPWATRLVVDGGGTVLVDEASLWPGGRFLTTEMVVRTQFLKAHRDVVERLLAAHIEATDFLNQHSDEAKTVVNAEIAKITGKPLANAVIQRAWASLTFTYEPLAATLEKQAADAASAGLLEKVSLKGLFDIGPLNRVLRAADRKEVTV
ncbi:MAG: ABC transporter substrate-binding protein [Actinomycetota bacterium]